MPQLRALVSCSQPRNLALRGDALPHQAIELFQLALRLLIFIVGVSVIQEIRNNSPVLDVVNLPEEFQDQGYTPDVVARNIKDRITEIAKVEKGIERQHPLALPADSPLPDLQLPEANVSLKTAILFIRQLLHFPPNASWLT